MSWNLEGSYFEGTEVSGLTVAAVADTPKIMSNGDWRIGVFNSAFSTSRVSW